MTSDVPDETCRTCRSHEKRTFVCVQCNNWAFCDECWTKRDVHEVGAVGWDGRPHEKSDPNVLRIFRQILDPCRNEADVETEHQADEETIWFGVDRDAPNGPVLQDYDRFATLVSEGQTLELGKKYPHLVSFIGQTGTPFQSVIHSWTSNVSLTQVRGKAPWSRCSSTELQLSQERMHQGFRPLLPLLGTTSPLPLGTFTSMQTLLRTNPPDRSSMLTAKGSMEARLFPRVFVIGPLNSSSVARSCSRIGESPGGSSSGL